MTKYYYTAVIDGPSYVCGFMDVSGDRPSEHELADACKKLAEHYGVKNVVINFFERIDE